MAIGRRRIARASSKTSQVSPSSVVFYSSVQYLGSFFSLQIDQDAASVPTGFDNTVQSLRHNVPAKLYMYEDNDFSGSILYTKNEDINDLGTRYFQSNWPFGKNISSVQVRSAEYVAPVVTSIPTLTFASGYTLPVLVNSDLYSNASVEELTYDIQDEATHTAFTAKMGTDTADQTANDVRMLTILNQVIRNACSILYRNSDQQPVRYPLTTLHFVTSTEYYAWATPASSDVFITSMLNDKSPAFVIAALAHELTHTYGHNKYYGSEPKVTGVCEGIAVYTMIEFGMRPVRPEGGGVNWYDGYETTALFFEYIMKNSPAPEPDFIYKLNMSMNAADPTIGKSTWSDSVITSLNSRGLAVDELWTEYKAWVSSNP